MNEPQKKYLTTKERICFTVGAFGRSGIYTLMSMFTLVFFQNGAGLSLSQGTTIILIGRIFDALNDPVMGMIVDRTKSKWGKMRPYLLFAPVPIAICTILLFTAPFKEGSTAAFVWALVTYILWGVAFTVQDVPFWGLSSVITPLESERTSFISTARLGSTFGGILPALLVPILYQSNMGYNKGFFVGALIFALLGCGLSILIFFVSKERVPKMDHTPSFKETFVVLGKNKLLLIVIAASVLGSTMVTANQCADYIGNYIIIQNYTDFRQIFMDFLPGAQSTLVPNVDAAAAYDFWIPRGTIVTTLTVAIACYGHLPPAAQEVQLKADLHWLRPVWLCRARPLLCDFGTRCNQDQHLYPVDFPVPDGSAPWHLQCDYLRADCRLHRLFGVEDRRAPGGRVLCIPNLPV